jgi:hypothetical protein
MQPGAILDGIHEIEKYDKMARRNYGLGDSTVGGSLSIDAQQSGGRYCQRPCLNSAVLRFSSTVGAVLHASLCNAVRQ